MNGSSWTDPLKVKKACQAFWLKQNKTKCCEIELFLIIGLPIQLLASWDMFTCRRICLLKVLTPETHPCTILVVVPTSHYKSYIKRYSVSNMAMWWTLSQNFLSIWSIQSIACITALNRSISNKKRKILFLKHKNILTF